MGVQASAYLLEEEELVPAESFQGTLPDPQRIRGSLELSVDGEVLLPRDLVDEVNQLWIGLSEGLTKVAKGRAWRTTYPQQPVELTLEPVGRSEVELTVSGQGAMRQATAQRSALLPALKHAGLAYTAAVGDQVPGAVALARRLEGLEL